MGSRKIEILQDIQEIKSHLDVAGRPNIRALLLSHVRLLDAEFRSLIQPEQDPAPSVVYKSIEKWAWDQDDNYVRVYITTLPNLKNHPKDKVDLQFNNLSVMVAIHDIDGVNYKVKFPKLANEISGCRVNMKSNGFGITMTKEEKKKNWNDLEFKRPFYERSEKDKRDKNVHEQFFDMMKSIYENGDEKVKQDIGVPWMKAMAETYRPITK